MLSDLLYETRIEIAIIYDYVGWSHEDQTILDQIRKGEIPVTDPRAIALWRWCQHNLVNHADGAMGAVAEELKALGVVAQEPPHFWPN